MEATNTMINTILSNVNSLIDFGGSLLQSVIEHPVLGFYFAAGFVGVGVAVIGSLIGLAQRN